MLGSYQSAIAKHDKDGVTFAAAVDSEARYLTMPITDNAATVESESTGTVEILLMRGALSVASKPVITMHYWSMEKRPRYKSRKVKGRIPSSGVAIGLEGH